MATPRHDPTEPDLDDPGYARFAWGRYRRLMRWMVLVAVLAAVAAVLLLRWFTGPMPLHMLVATIAGVVGSVLLGTALMGLVFLSSGTGHDTRIEDPSRPEDD